MMCHLHENYKLLLDGDIGENLMSKYTAKGLLILDDIITTIFLVLKKMFRKNYNSELNTILDSSEKWLKNLHLIDSIFSDKNIKKNNKLKIDFDFPAWLKNSKLPFENFKNNSIYEFNLDIKKIKYIRNEIKSISLVNKDEQRAFGRYLERRSSESSFLEKEFEKVV